MKRITVLMALVGLQLLVSSSCTDRDQSQQNKPDVTPPEPARQMASLGNSSEFYLMRLCKGCKYFLVTHRNLYERNYFAGAHGITPLSQKIPVKQGMIAFSAKYIDVLEAAAQYLDEDEDFLISFCEQGKVRNSPLYPYSPFQTGIDISDN